MDVLRRLVTVALVGIAVQRAIAGDPGPTQSVSPDGNVYHSPIPINSPFPDANYGADHGGSNLSIVYPYVSQFGYTDHSRGYFQYYVAPFYPRNSEGVFGMDIWLEQQDSSGNWNAVAGQYQPVNTPNPGPSPSYSFTWSYGPFPPNTNFRIFVYVYIYNQGGGNQGDFPIYSTTATVNTGAANDAPRINWSSPFGSLNPGQVQAGQTYTISADGQDDNGNLVAVSINKNGQPFAYAGGGNGYAGNSQNPTSDPVGTVTFTAWANDSYGAQSPTITWTVNVVGKSNQPSVGSGNASFQFYSQNFTPSYSGGVGSGAWQFCVINYTNWDGGNSSYAGTNLGPSPGNAPGANWVTSWSPPAPGTYSFYVAKDGDANYNPSSAAGPYTLTVTPATPVGSFDGVTPNPVTQGQAITGSGWAADAQLGAPMSAVTLLIDGGGNGSFSAGLGGYRPDVQSANASWGHWSPSNLSSSGWGFSYSTAGLAQGGHTLTAVAYDYSYGVSATIGSQSFTVSAPLGQTVTISPTSAAIHPGQTVTFSASGGANGYVWGGSANGGGGSQSVTFPSQGNYSVTVYSPAGNGYGQSNTATATISVTSATQTVSLAPANATVYTGQSVSFAASGGQNGYVWGGAASGGSSSQNVGFASPGSYSVTVYSPAGGAYSQSNTAAAIVSVATRPAATITASPSPISIGQSSTISANFTADSAHGDSLSNTVIDVVNPQGVETNLSGYGGASIGATFAPASVGSYTFKANAQTGLTPSWVTYASTTVGVGTATQAVTISPANATVSAGQQVTFTANGGSTGYVWGGSASGGGSTQTVSFPGPGSYLVTVYAPANANFAQSNIASSTVTVNPDSQTVAISPVSPSVTAGGSLVFTATGGQNGYVWGGFASGSGSTQSLSFPNVGTFQVTVYSPAGGVYSASNTATATIMVTAASQTVSLAPPTASINAGQSVAFNASGGMNGYSWGGSANGTGTTQTVVFASAGTFAVTVFSPAGGNFTQSNTASSTVTVASLPPPSSAQVSVSPQGGQVKVQNKENIHNSPIVVPGP